MSKIVFGINMSYNLSCAALVDGEIKVAITEERLNRKKNCDGQTYMGAIIPHMSINYCCHYLNIDASDVDLWVVSGIAPYVIKPMQLQLIGIPKEKIVMVPGHYLAHAYASFFTSSFDESAILVYDVKGGIVNRKRENYMIFRGHNHKIEPVYEDFLSHGEMSVAELYALYCALLQLSPDKNGEYGTDDYHSSWRLMMNYASEYHNKDLWKKNHGLIKRTSGSKFELREYNGPDIVENENDRYVIQVEKLVEYLKQEGKVNDYIGPRNFNEIFARNLKTRIKWNYRDNSLKKWENVIFAYEAQKMLEEVMVKMAKKAYDITKSVNLCLSGKTALNTAVCNCIKRNTAFENIYVQASPDDDGNAIGAALYGYFEHLKGNKFVYMDNAFRPSLGEQYSREEIDNVLLKNWMIPFKTQIADEEQQIDTLIKRINHNDIIFIFRGRSEFGQQTTGNRAIIASAGSNSLKGRVRELKGLKWNESLICFVLEERFNEYFFEEDNEDKQIVFQARYKEEVMNHAPAICQADGTAVIHKISEVNHPFYYNLLKNYGKIKGHHPILAATTLDIDETICETPLQVIDTFLRVHYKKKMLLLEDYLIEAEEFSENAEKEAFPVQQN